MSGHGDLVIRYRWVAWLALLLPVIAVGQRATDVVQAASSGTGRVGAVVSLAVGLLLAVAVTRLLWRVLSRNVVTADRRRLVFGTLVDTQVELPWEAVAEIRLQHAWYGGKLTVTVPNPAAHVPAVRTVVDPAVDSLREPLRTILSAPARADDWLANRWRERGRLTVPLLLTKPGTDQLTAPLMELAAGRCPVVKTSRNETA